jgi:ATP-binding cassette subfamily A (ABC1) protein 3
MGIRNNGISVTTMEEVFLKIASDGDEDTILSPGSPSPVTPEAEDEGENAWALYRSQESSLGRQIRALVTKRFHNIKRDRRTQYFQIVTPIVCIIITMLFTLIPIPSLP